MSLLTAAARSARALPNLAWQLSSIPSQLLTSQGIRTDLPFLAAVAGTAALGVVEWPVALLVAGGYLLQRSPKPQPTAPGAGGGGRPSPRPAQGGPEPASPARKTAAAAAAAPAEQVPGEHVHAQPVPSGPPAPSTKDRTPSATVEGVPGPTAAERGARQNVPAHDRDEQPAQQIDLQNATRPPGQPGEVAPTPRAAARDGGEPWPGYNQLTVRQVVDRLDNGGKVDLDAVDRYESAHRNRKTVHAALAQRGTAGS